VAAVVVLLLIVGALVLGGGKKASAGEVFLDPAPAPGADPFTPSVAAPAPGPSTVPTAAPVATTAPATTAGGAIVLHSQAGQTPGLYGGTRDQSSCDPAGMISYLSANPGKAAAWAGAEGIAVADVPAYIRGLTPVVLRADTRVTNHGYRNGRATAHQSVLQAGTAVLVDHFGVPRARCACGNPLLPPRPVRSHPTYQGPPWPAFDPGAVVVVQPSPTVINVFNLVDPRTGTSFGRPAGTSGASDGPPSPAGTVATSTSTSPASTTTTSSASRGAVGTLSLVSLTGADRVGPGADGLAPNGTPDVVLHLQASGPVNDVILTVCDAQGHHGGSQWDTLVGDRPAPPGYEYGNGASTWVLGVGDDSSVRNNPDGSLAPLDLPPGSTLTLYAEQNGSVVSGAVLCAGVVRPDGRVDEAMTTVP
jgi:hypothetical protein